ncbi:MAG: 3-phosphoshikimate 1-carboxyvinyltransferase [Steroidobacteraceae bacterium]
MQFSSDAGTAMGSGPNWLVTPATEISGSLSVPGDKSISHRALMLGGIADGCSTITGLLRGEDVLATMKAMRAMGVRIDELDPQSLRVHGSGYAALNAATEPLDLGNSGTAMRLFMGLLCGLPFPTILTGDESLRSRPMERVAKPLRAMGAGISTTEGHAPVTLHGGRRLAGIDYEMPVASAQVKSAILLAAIPAGGITRLIEPHPSRDHTEIMLQQFGVRLERNGNAVSLAGGQSLRGTEVAIPGDISSAAFLIVAALLARKGRLLLRNVGINPTRTAVLDVLRAMGGKIEVKLLAGRDAEPRGDIVVFPSELRAIRIDAAMVPRLIDELPVIFVAAAAAQGTTHVDGAAELRVKESDRLASMSAGLANLGVEHHLAGDSIAITGGEINGGRVESFGDHRIAMAFAVAAMRASGPIHIADVRNVATSFPDFASLARHSGLPVQECS